MRPNLKDIQTFSKSLKYGDVFILQAREMKTVKEHFLVIVGGDKSEKMIFFAAISSNLNTLKSLTPRAADNTYVEIKKEEYEELDHTSYVNCNLIPQRTMEDLFTTARQFKAQRKPIEQKIVNRILNAIHQSKSVTKSVLAKLPMAIDKRGNQKVM